ncbi:MAG: cell division protein FtsQ/DivIB [Halanaerobiales bacterium]
MNEKRGIIIGLLVTVGLISFLSSPLFRLSRIEVTGLKILEQEEVVTSSFRESYEGKNIFLLNREQMSKKILDNPYVSEVIINRKLPSAIRVQVEERKPVGKINNNGNYLVFDHQGVILEECSQNTRFDVPEFRGLGYSFSGEKLDFSPELSQLVTALRQVDFKRRLQLTVLETEDNDYYGKMEGDIDIFLGGEERLERKFAILNSTINKINSEQLAVDYIDLQSVSRPVLRTK